MKDGVTHSENKGSDLIIAFWEVRDKLHVFHTERMFTYFLDHIYNLAHSLIANKHVKVKK